MGQQIKKTYLAMALLCLGLGAAEARKIQVRTVTSHPLLNENIWNHLHFLNATSGIGEKSSGFVPIPTGFDFATGKKHFLAIQKVFKDVFFAEVKQPSETVMMVPGYINPFSFRGHGPGNTAKTNGIEDVIRQELPAKSVSIVPKFLGIESDPSHDLILEALSPDSDGFKTPIQSPIEKSRRRDVVDQLSKAGLLDHVAEVIFVAPGG